MNTANLQLEGLHLCLASLTNALVAKGVIAREEIDAAYRSAEERAVSDFHSQELSPANRDALAFPARLLRLMNNASSDGEIPRFSEMAKLVGELKAQGADRSRPPAGNNR